MRTLEEIQNMISSYLELKAKTEEAMMIQASIESAQTLNSINSALVDLLLEAAGSTVSTDITAEEIDALNRFELFLEEEEKVSIAS
jgi:hypothetical protein